MEQLIVTVQNMRQFGSRMLEVKIGITVKKVVFYITIIHMKQRIYWIWYPLWLDMMSIALQGIYF